MTKKTMTKTKSAGKYFNIETAQRVGVIRDELEEIIRGLEGKYNLKYTADPHNVSAVGVSDFLCNLEYQIIAKTDGRPRALDFVATHGHSSEVISQVGAGANAYMVEKNEELARWAECYSPGYETKACLGDLECGAKELILIRNWIDSVIKWHEQNPKKRKA